MGYKIKLSTIEIILLVLTVIKISFIPNDIFMIIRYLTIIYFIVRYFKNFFDSKLVLGLFFAYTIILSYSSWINTSSVTWTISAAALGLNYIVIFVVFSKFCKDRTNDELIILLIRILGCLIIINDFFFLIASYNFANADETYIIGNKFEVAFCHALLACLIYVRGKSIISKVETLAFLVYSIIISMIVNCTTGIVILSVLVIMLWSPNWLKVVLEKPYTFILALGGENILIWGTTQLFKQPYVQNIIVNVFHKSPDMTGRERLYRATLNLVQEKPLWGYGYNTDIYRIMFGYGNAQNGLFHIITQAGIIGAVIYFLGIVFALAKADKNHSMYGMYMYIYAMLIGSAVEINLSKLFIMGVAVIFACNKTLQNINEENKRKGFKIRKKVKFIVN